MAKSRDEVRAELQEVVAHLQGEPHFPKFSTFEIDRGDAVQELGDRLDRLSWAVRVLAEAELVRLSEGKRRG